MTYVAQGVIFDGSTTYLNVGGASGAADSKLLTFSLWVRSVNAAGTDRIWEGTGRCDLTYESNEVYRIRGDNAANTRILDIETSVYADTAWHHIMGSVDMADTGKRHLYVDDISDLTVVTYTDDTLDFVVTDYFVGINSALGNIFAGDLADVWIGAGQYVDLSVEANRRKFIGANGGAVDLGSDGSTPTGVAPLIYLSGATASWHTNKGTGGGFTETGELTDAATNPPSEPDAGGNPWWYYANQEAVI